MELEEFLKNGIFSKSKLAVSLYSGEDKKRAYKRFMKKLNHYNRNKFSEEEIFKIYKILDKEHMSLEEIMKNDIHPEN